MKIKLHFGDYFNDGHGRYETVIAEVPKLENVSRAIKDVKKKYPCFFSTFAADAYDSSIGLEVERALLETNYPVERFKVSNDDIRYEEFTSLEALFNSDEWKKMRTPSSFDFIIDGVIWVLNAFGAGIEMSEEENSFYFDFECGYGWFYE